MSADEKLFVVFTTEDGDVIFKEITEEALSSFDYQWVMKERMLNEETLKRHHFGNDPGVLFIRGRIVQAKPVETVTKWRVE